MQPFVGCLIHVVPSVPHQVGGNSSSPKVEGSASQQPTPPSTAGASATQQQSKGSRLCHQVYDIVKDLGPSARWKQEMSSLSPLLHQLSKLAGGSRQMPGYCAQYLGALFPDGTIPRIPGSGDQGTESSKAGPDNQGALAHL